MDTSISEVLHTLNLESGPVKSISMAVNGKLTVANGDR